MRIRWTLLCLGVPLIFASLAMRTQSTYAAHQLPKDPREDVQIEPNAGKWRTWIISSGREFRVPPPPGPADTRAELRTLPFEPFDVLGCTG